MYSVTFGICKVAIYLNDFLYYLYDMLFIFMICCYCPKIMAALRMYKGEVREKVQNKCNGSHCFTDFMLAWLIDFKSNVLW